jgi:hypothetical protein
MTPEEAIKILRLLSWGNEIPQVKRIKACKLGIEALKLVLRERLLGINPVETILPGETKE